MVSADRTRFAQIVMNLGSNAIKYNRPGGSVTLCASLSTPATLRVVVADTGIGIPVDKQSKLFQPFQRAGQETGPIEGTGIGLVITKRLAELMGGSVGFRSAPGAGSEFWVDLPAHVPRASADATAVAPADSTPRLEGRSGRLVLYVEDNPANVSFMRDVLGDFDGIELATVPTAEMGIELVRSRRPDVVIMDINLPGMSGLDALERTPEGSEDRRDPDHRADGCGFGARSATRDAGRLLSIPDEARESGRTRIGLGGAPRVDGVNGKGRGHAQALRTLLPERGSEPGNEVSLFCGRQVLVGPSVQHVFLVASVCAKLVDEAARRFQPDGVQVHAASQFDQS